MPTAVDTPTITGAAAGIASITTMQVKSAFHGTVTEVGALPTSPVNNLIDPLSLVPLS